jgi:hypothetical protein
MYQELLVFNFEYSLFSKFFFSTCCLILGCRVLEGTGAKKGDAEIGSFTDFEVDCRVRYLFHSLKSLFISLLQILFHSFKSY